MSKKTKKPAPKKAKPTRKPKAPPKSKLRDEIDPLPADYKAEANDEYINASASDAAKQKRQEYNRRMGHTKEFLHDLAERPDDPEIKHRLSRFVSNTAEDDRRFINRRQARSVSLAVARDRLFVRMFEEAAGRMLTGKITPRGYGQKKPSKIAKRITNLFLSDLHIGATLDGRELPEGFGWTEAARRLAYVTLQAAEYKTQYRDRQALNVLLNGDVIEGLLGHDQADGSPLTEQCIAFLKYMGHALAHLAAAYPTVTVWCEPGNHGRNKLRHEGRATNQKWDSTETVLYVALKMMCARLENVRFEIPHAPAVVVPLFDRAMLMTHGDTHLKIGDPDTKAQSYEIALNKINGTLEYGRHIDLLAVGHFHKGRHLELKRSAVLVNGALVPPNGHAKTEGYDSACGQWLWESVPGYALGDSRFVRVGPEQDRDASLDKVIPTFTGAW